MSKEEKKIKRTPEIPTEKAKTFIFNTSKELCWLQTTLRVQSKSGVALVQLSCARAVLSLGRLPHLLVALRCIVAAWLLFLSWGEGSDSSGLGCKCAAEGAVRVSLTADGIKDSPDKLRGMQLNKSGAVKLHLGVVRGRFE